MYFFLRKLGFDKDEVSFILERIYNNPSYHGEYHIGRLWELFEQNRDKYDEYTDTIIGTTIIFHDLVYDIGKKNNERLSFEYLVNLCDRSGYIKITEEQLYHIGQIIIHTDPLKYGFVISGSFADMFIREYDIYDLIETNVDRVCENARRLAIENNPKKDPDITKKTVDFLKGMNEKFPIEDGVAITIKFFEENGFFES